MEESQFTCVVCRALPTDVVESGCCASLFCWECAVKTRELCPVCSAKFDREACRMNLPLRRIIDNVPRRCKFGGCSKLLKGPEMAEHLAVCPERPVVCPNSELCGILSAKELDSHLTTKCEYRQVSCHLCEVEMAFKSLETHLESECPGVTVECPNRCSAQMKRKELEEHFHECPMQVILCEFADCGCNAQLTRMDYRKHAEDPAVQHTHLLLMKKRFETQLEQMQAPPSADANNNVRPQGPCAIAREFNGLVDKVCGMCPSLCPARARGEGYPCQQAKELLATASNEIRQLSIKETLLYLVMFIIFSSFSHLFQIGICFLYFQRSRKSYREQNYKDLRWNLSVLFIALSTLLPILDLVLVATLIYKIHLEFGHLLGTVVPCNNRAPIRT